jgi:putative ABC transport system substrate-binding protein
MVLGLRGEAMRRREFITLLGSGAVAAWPLAARAQQGRLPRIGALVLTSADAQALGNELREGLRELGYVEGQNFAFEVRFADGNADRLAELAAELVRLRVDVIVAAYTPCAVAAKRATTAIPIVMAAVADPIGAGLVQSLARPGGNITGLSNMAAETAGKSVELVRDMLPSLRRVAVLANPVDPFTKSLLEQVHLAGRTGGIEIAPVAMVRDPNEIEVAFADIASKQAQAVVVQAIFFAKAIADLAIKYRLPSAAVLRSYPHAGGLMSYGADVPHLFRRSAALVHKILQGAKSADLPVEQPTKFELVVNLKTAKAIGLSIPESFLLRADELIE